jgi:hypothetical protein
VDVFGANATITPEFGGEIGRGEEDWQLASRRSAATRHRAGRTLLLLVMVEATST